MRLSLQKICVELKFFSLEGNRVVESTSFLSRMAHPTVATTYLKQIVDENVLG